jgi:hypothetical protein
MIKDIENYKFKAELVWAATRQGSFQRSRLYKDGIVTDFKKKEFRRYVKAHLFNHVFVKYYNSFLTEKDLYQIIGCLQNDLAIKFPNILKGRKIRFGNAQKMVNLYLKNMWIAGWVGDPPHFPVDRIIQSGLGEIIPWTDMDKVEYKAIISKAKIKMKADGYKSIALWEANKYFEYNLK